MFPLASPRSPCRTGCHSSPRGPPPHAAATHRRPACRRVRPSPSKAAPGSASATVSPPLLPSRSIVPSLSIREVPVWAVGPCWTRSVERRPAFARFRIGRPRHPAARSAAGLRGSDCLARPRRRAGHRAHAQAARPLRRPEASAPLALRLRRIGAAEGRPWPMLTVPTSALRSRSKSPTLRTREPRGPSLWSQPPNPPIPLPPHPLTPPTPRPRLWAGCGGPRAGEGPVVCQRHVAAPQDVPRFARRCRAAAHPRGSWQRRLD